jgi:L-rhamnonate dehydratase
MAIERHYRVINNINFHFGRCWPLALAQWDLAGKITNQPVWPSSGTLRSASEMVDMAVKLPEPRSLGKLVRFKLTV